MKLFKISYLRGFASTELCSARSLLRFQTLRRDASSERSSAAQRSDKTPLYNTFSDQFLSILSDSYYSLPMKNDIKTRDQKLSKNFFMSCKENLIINNRNFYSSFYLGPFESGQSITVANALRRTLLSEISGLAITTVQIEGVMHEYSTIPGVKDTVLDILLNLKEIVIKSNYLLDIEQGDGYIQARGPGVIRASDIKLPSYLLCVDPDQYIATLSDDGVLNMKLTIQSGKLYNSQKQILEEQSKISRNFVPTTQSVGTESHLVEKSIASSGDRIEKPSNLLVLDPVFTPVTKVNYIVEQNPQDFSSQIIILEIWTNGSIHPRKALYDGLKKLINIFSNLKNIQMFESPLKSNKTYSKMYKLLDSRETIAERSSDEAKPRKLDETFSHSEKLGNKQITSMETNSKKMRDSKQSSAHSAVDQDLKILNLSLRAYNALKNINIHKVEDLLNSSVSELFEKNIGKHILLEVQQKLRKKGLFLNN